MFDIVRNNRRIVQIFLALITLPFAFFGVDSYIRSSGSSNAVAKVGGSSITPQEFQQALQAQQDRMRASMGPGVPAEMLDTPEIRKAVLNSLVDQRLLALHASKARIGVSDGQLLQYISSVPSLQENGKFSRERYEAVVAAQGMSKEAFESRLRQDLALQQAVGAVADASFTGQLSSRRWLGAMLEEREISEAMIAPEQFAGQVKLPPDAVGAFYEAHKKEFAVPEQVKVEYLVLSQAGLAEQATVTDEEVSAWYKAHQEQYKQPEQRNASHILIVARKDAAEAEVKAAQAKAEELLAKVRKTPGEFAALAKQYSQDPGSAQKGGDLGWFGHGMMVKAFDDAAFALKEGEISGVVRSDFGFHIIRLTGVHPERVKPFDEVRSEISDELRKQQAAKKYAESAESFSNTVYEQADSLKPAADKFKLKTEQSDWIAKGAPGKTLLDNPKLSAALFSDDAIKNKRNTEAVEVSPGTLVTAHVIDHRDAAVRPLDSVRADIEKRLVLDEAAKIARKTGEDKLALLAKGASPELHWGATRSVPRAEPQGLSQAAAKLVFQADTAKLPTYVGTPAANGAYTIYRISQVKAFSNADDPRAKTLREQYGRVVAGEEFTAWLTTLRARYPVEINNKLLEAKER